MKRMVSALAVALSFAGSAHGASTDWTVDVTTLDGRRFHDAGTYDSEVAPAYILYLQEEDPARHSYHFNCLSLAPGRPISTHSVLTTSYIGSVETVTRSFDPLGIVTAMLGAAVVPMVATLDTGDWLTILPKMKDDGGLAVVVAAQHKDLVRIDTDAVGAEHPVVDPSDLLETITLLPNQPVTLTESGGRTLSLRLIPLIQTAQASAD